MSSSWVDPWRHSALEREGKGQRRANAGPTGGQRGANVGPMWGGHGANEGRVYGGGQHCSVELQVLSDVRDCYCNETSGEVPGKSEMRQT